MLKLTVLLYCASVVMLVASFYPMLTHDPPEPPAKLDYEEIGFCFWERYDPAELVSEMVRDVRFCIEVYPHSQR